MTKLKNLFIFTLLIGGISLLSLSMMDKSYSYGVISQVAGEEGNYVLEIFDADTEYQISCDTAYKYYGMDKYQRRSKNGKAVYFYNCKQITKSEYETGYPREQADIRAAEKGDSAIRVHNTAEIKRALDKIYNNYKIGTFYFEFAENEDIDWDEVRSYFDKNYGVVDYRQNYYDYNHKGRFEPSRYGWLDIISKKSGTVELVTTNIRISGNEQKVADEFINKLLPHLKGDGSDYQKILATYEYITQFTSYLTDNGFDNSLDSNTSIYDVFINRKSVCIGYSIAFSYIMDKFGIESYIVDQITENDLGSMSFSSVHTYNIVKLDNKFYKIDLTGNQFLTGLSSNALYDNKLKISTSSYNKSGKITSYSFNKSQINSYLNEAKKIKTTTTKKIEITTTRRQTTKITGGNKRTTKKATSYEETRKTTTAPKTTTNNKTTTTADTYTPDKTTTTKNQYIKPDAEITKTTTTTKKIEIDNNNKNNITNVMLFVVGGVVIVIYFIYKGISNKKKRYDDDIDDILNKYRGK